MNKHTVYFLSSHQQRGMMAEIWANRLKLPNWEIRSAAWKEPVLDNTTFEIMKEIVLDLPIIEPRPYDPQKLREADLIVAFYDGDFELPPVPEDIPAGKLLMWDIRNPELRASDEAERWAMYQEICDEIAVNVKELEPYFRFQYM